MIDPHRISPTMLKFLDQFGIPTSDGPRQLPGFAWPGGYPILYGTEGGDELCYSCANKVLSSLDSMDRIVSYWIVDDPAYSADEGCAECGITVLEL